MKIDPKQMPAMYDWLRVASPSLSGLPSSDRVRFESRSSGTHYGQCRIRAANLKRGLKSGFGQVATIILTTANRDILMCVETMAHEMCHLVQYSEEMAARGVLRSASHGPKFQRLARQVCAELHLNEYTF